MQLLMAATRAIQSNDLVLISGYLRVHGRALRSGSLVGTSGPSSHSL